MEKNKNLFPGNIEGLSEEQKLELFKVEELEARLEMSTAVDAEAAEGDTNKVCWIG